MANFTLSRIRCHSIWVGFILKKFCRNYTVNIVMNNDSINRNITHPNRIAGNPSKSKMNHSS